jgi:hypothetical protein
LFARTIARALNVKTPEAVHLSELNVDLTETRPIERRADSVLRVEFMVEDPGGDYITFLQNTYDCDVVLLVVCSRKATAKWAREPIKIGRPGLVGALASALNTIDTAAASELAEFTEAGLGDTAGLKIWRKLMATETFRYMSETRVKGRIQGRVEEGARAVLRVLKRRDVAVDDDSRKRIESCTNLETLETWLDRAVTAHKVKELFED